MGFSRKSILGVASVLVAIGLAVAFAASAWPSHAPQAVQGRSDAGGPEAPTGADNPEPLIKPGRDCGPSKDLTGRQKSWNAHFMKWEIREDVIHVLPGLFEGRDEHNVTSSQTLLVGFEFVGGTPESLDAAITDNPDHDIRVVLDGTPVAGDWKAGYQPAYVAETQCGAAWSWDHDGDGPGDGNGNGIGDFSGGVLFWRAPLGPLAPGTYVLEVGITDDAGATWFAIPGGTINVT